MVITIVFGDSFTSQSHECPLDSSHVLPCDTHISQMIIHTASHTHRKLCVKIKLLIGSLCVFTTYRGEPSADLNLFSFKIRIKAKRKSKFNVM